VANRPFKQANRRSKRTGIYLPVNPRQSFNRHPAWPHSPAESGKPKSDVATTATSPCRPQLFDEDEEARKPDAKRQPDLMARRRQNFGLRLGLIRQHQAST